MDMKIYKLDRIVSVIRNLIDPELPIQQLALLLLVAEAGDEGITMPDACKKLGMGQTSVSKNAKMLSRYAEERGGQMEIKGYELIEARPDLWERRRLRMTITPKGIDVLKKIKKEVV
jgi:DNA-binding MarR family transcriptional regulator